jgi:hypothetical protein
MYYIIKVLDFLPFEAHWFLHVAPASIFTNLNFIT